LSYEILEQPVRISSVLDRHRTAVIAGGLALSIVGGLVFIPAIMDRNNRAAAASTATLGSKVSAGDTRVPVPRGLLSRPWLTQRATRPPGDDDDGESARRPASSPQDPVERVARPGAHRLPPRPRRRSTCPTI